MLKGIYTPSLATFLDDGGINESELRRMINWLIEKGVSGLYPDGSTGEFIRLSFEERKRVIQIVAEETHGSFVLPAVFPWQPPLGAVSVLHAWPNVSRHGRTPRRRSTA